MLPAVLGTIAQQGQAAGGGSGPTNVSIATSSSGDFNNAWESKDNGTPLITVWDNEEMTHGGSHRIDPDEYDAGHGGGGGSQAYVHAYLRATSATSYSMQGSIEASSLSNSCSVAWTGGAFTSQDGTGGGGIGYFVLAHGGGRGNVLTPDDGDTIDITVEATATNSGGDTDATTITAQFLWQQP